MATYVQGTSGISDSRFDALTLSNVQSGNLVVASIVCLDTTVPTPTDPNSRVTWTAATSNLANGSANLKIFYGIAGSTGTVQCRTGNSDIGLCAMAEYSGVASSSTLDTNVTNGGTGESNSPSSGAATTDEAGLLLIGAVGYFAWSARTGSQGSGWTERQDAFDSIYMGQGIYLESIDSAANSTSYTATATMSQSVTWCCQMCAFRASGGASSTLVPFRRMNVLLRLCLSVLTLFGRLFR